MKNFDFDSEMKKALTSKAKLSKDSELSLFTQAENLLSVRRDRATSRETLARKTNLAKKRWIFAIPPNAPAAATTFIVLVLALITYSSRWERHFKENYADLPEFPKTNDFPESYDAQILADRQTYEREVEDAHRRTSGGI